MARKDGRTDSKRGMENTEYAVMLRRMIRRYGERVGDSDWTDLETMLEMRDAMDEAITVAVREQRRRHGFSWADIGRGAGITRQGAQQRWGEPVDGVTSGVDSLVALARTMTDD